MRFKTKNCFKAQLFFFKSAIVFFKSAIVFSKAFTLFLERDDFVVLF
jgi:hypothetical protein